MLNNVPIDLLATCWTTAGNAKPLSEDERSPFTLQTRIEAAAAAGYRGFGLLHADLVVAEQQLGLSGLRKLLADNGIVHLELEMLNDWYSDGERRAVSDQVRNDLLKAAAALGARHIKAGGEITAKPVDFDAFAAEFRHLCGEAADAGTRVVFEPMPFGNISTLDSAVRLIDTAGHPAGGLMLDVWHVVRGGFDFTSIAALPARYVFAVELDDGDAEAIGSPVEDTIDRRRLCGQGSFDIRGFIQAVRATGFDGPWGVEIISEEHRVRTLEEQAQISFTTTMDQFQAVEA